MAASDEYRNSIATINQTRPHSPPSSGSKASTTPKPVATALPLEPKPHRKAMAQNRAIGGHDRHVLPVDAGQQDRRRAFAGVEQQGHQRQSLVAGAQHIGGADIAAANGANIAKTGEAGQQQPAGHRAQQIAKRGGGVKWPGKGETAQGIRHDPSPRPRRGRRTWFRPRAPCAAPVPRPAGLEGAVFRLAVKAGNVDAPRDGEVDKGEIGNRADRQTAGRQGQNIGRAIGQRGDRAVKGQMAGVDQFQGQRQQGFQTDDPGVGLGEGQAFGILRPRGVVAGDGVDGAIGEAGDHR